MLRYLVFDLECMNIRSYGSGKSGNIFDTRNRVVNYSMRRYDWEETKLVVNYDYDNEKFIHKNLADEVPNFLELEVDLVVAHNISYDLKYCLRNPDNLKWLLQGGQIWCTATGEYFKSNHLMSITARDHLSLSLDNVAKLYGGTAKDDRVKTFWNDGIQTQDIPRDILEEYVVEDSENLHKVFVGQYKWFTATGKLQLAQCHMDWLLACIQMESHGFHINKEWLIKEKQVLENQLHLANRYIKKLVNKIEATQYIEGLTEKQYKPRPCKIGELAFKDGKFNDGVDMLSMLVFGGNKKIAKGITHTSYDAEGKPLEFKKDGKTGRKGDIKTKKYDLMITTTGLGETPRDKWASKKEGVWSVDKDTVKYLSKNTTSADTKLFLKLLLKIRGVSKQIEKFNEFEKGMMPDNKIHQSLNNTLTKTARLSCSNPNMQNLASPDKSLVINAIQSRYGDEGCIMEIDWAQLEVICQGWVTQDPGLIKDIKQGIDFHCKRLAYIEKMDYEEVALLAKGDKDKEIAADPVWANKRKKIKFVSFSMQYNSTVKSMAERLDMDEEEVQAIVDAEKAMYPLGTDFGNMVRKQAEANMQHIGRVDKDTEIPILGGTWSSPIGHTWTYYTNVRWNKKRRRHEPQMSHTQTFNYQTQGTAADVVALIGGVMNRVLMAHPDKIVMFNSVHDSYWFDVKEKHLDYFRELLLNICHSMPSIFKQYFGVEWNVPIKADSTVGKTLWLTKIENDEDLIKRYRSRL